jgi:hypothetical protein
MGKRAENEQRARAWLAWNSGTIGNWKKIPSLAEFMQIKKAAPRPARRQSPEIQLAQMKAAFIAFGGDPDDLKKVH